ncbi:MAG TPA: TadE/TadG family type IV pilus assembly protein, partial [Mycobacteriales bacterium]|nr:TadE/TadG family type IV pilus assembly protein [Mycobacteriales bacterium]
MVVSGRRDTARSGTDGSMYRAMKRRVRRSEPKTRRSRGRDDRGAVLIEAAFLLPFLFALLFGIIDFGFTFNDWISVRQGGRDGLRQMIVNANPTPPAPSTTWAGAGCVQNGGPDSVTSAHAYSVMCFTKLRVGLDQS